jgi:hypothetical protein
VTACCGVADTFAVDKLVSHGNADWPVLDSWQAIEMLTAAMLGYDSAGGGLDFLITFFGDSGHLPNGLCAIAERNQTIVRVGHFCQWLAVALYFRVIEIATCIIPFVIGLSFDSGHCLILIGVCAVYIPFRSLPSAFVQYC